ncbi:MAG: response regulator [Dethiobacteria bacterium]
MSNAPRILVVDDELGPREALRMILRDDYDVVTAGNGNRALEYLDSAEFDLVILDIRMPDISGIDLLAEVKKKGPGNGGGNDYRLCVRGYGDQCPAQRRAGLSDQAV